MKKILFLIILISAVSFHADTKEKREKKYTFHPASIFEIPQNDPYKMHIKISDNTNECRALTVVLKTGQTTSYTNYDDGYYQKGAARSYTRDNAKEIVTDNTTNLQWQDNSDAKTVQKTWSEAKEYCENLTLGGYDDWRLPSMDELLTIVDYGRYSPAINPVFQNVGSFWKNGVEVDDYIVSSYWSSTNFAFNNSLAWSVVFHDYNNYIANTIAEFTSNNNLIRCVRGERLERGNFSRDDTKEIVTDNCTKLQWQDNSEAKTVQKTWSEAISYCENLTLGGYDDWRLPNINELYSIVDFSRKTINSVFKNIFPDDWWFLEGYFLWSSTSSESNISLAWGIELMDINTIDYEVRKSFSAFVRCVRGGQ